MPDLLGLARQKIDECAGDLEAAQEKLIVEAAADRDVSQAMHAYAAHDLVRQALIRERRQMDGDVIAKARERGRQCQARDARGGRARNRAAQEVTLMLMPLPFHLGTKLGDATREQIEDVVQKYKGLSQHAQGEASFYDKIARAMQRAKGDDRVRDKMTEEKLRRLRDQTKAAA